MILDMLENGNNYVSLNGRFAEAFAFLAEKNFEELPDGRYEIDGEDLFAVVMSYTTRPVTEVEWEAHQKYLDIQYLARGKEIIGWAPLNQLTLSRPYSEEKDIAFFKDPQIWTAVNMGENYFAIFYPEDAHQPCCIYDEPANVKKVVIKVKLL